ncbi:MAG: STAS domain-containing protein [Devosia sp.]
MAEAAGKTVALPPVIDLDSLDRVRDQLLDAVETGPVVVDGSAVRRVATNALFMLVSAAETARRNGFSLELRAQSQALSVAVARLGLGERFAGFTRG